MQLTLPPVDCYRKPFVEPLGHLAMQAAEAESAMIELCTLASLIGRLDNATLEEKDEARVAQQGKVIACLRNWNGGKQANRYILRIDDIAVRRHATELVETYTTLMELRNRFIHDAVSVGITEDNLVEAISVSNVKINGTGQVNFKPVTPYDIAALACEVYDLQKDLNAVSYGLQLNHDL